MCFFSMEHNKAPGFDDFPAEFYQAFWDIIKYDLKAMLDYFHKGVLHIERINYGNITLLPKSIDADKIQKYRPVCLLNTSYNFFYQIDDLKTY